MADLDYDFYGTQIQARIVVPGATTAPFDPTSDDLNTPDFIRFIYKTLEQITVDEEMGTIGTIEVTFTPTYEIALDMLESKYIKVGNILYVRWGYSKSEGQLSPWKSGLIVSPPRVQLGPITRITIVANAWGHEMARTTRIKIDGQGSLVGTYQQVFKQILKKWQVDTLTNLDDTKATKFYKESQVTPFNTAVQSDYDILRRLANDSGNDFLMSGPTVKVVSMKNKFDNPEPLLTWTLYGQLEPFRGDFPMYDFEFQADALFLPQFQKGVFSDTVDGDNKSTTLKSQTPTAAGMKAGSPGNNGAELTSAPVTGGSGPPQRAKNNQGGNTATQRPLVRQNESDLNLRQFRLPQPGVNTKNKATRSGEVDAKALMQGAFIKVSFNAMGVPFIEPSELVNLAGVGIFNGIYYLTSVSHVIGRGGYDVACEGINQTSSNALKVLTPPEKNAGTTVKVGSQPEQPTDQSAGAGQTNP